MAKISNYPQQTTVLGTDYLLLDNLLSTNSKKLYKIRVSDFATSISNQSSITGLIQAGTNVTLTGSGTSLSPYVINAGTALALTGDITGSGTSSIATTLSNTGVTAGSYTNANVTVDSKGRVTSVTNGGSSGLTLQTNSVNNGSQTTLNLVAGSNITLSDNGTGNVTVNSVAAGTGTVTNFAYTNGNGLVGAVSNATTTPTLSISTNLTGIIKGNGTALLAASAGSDYVVPNSHLTSISSLTYTSGSPFVKMTGSGSFSLDTNTYLSSSAIGSTVQAQLVSGTNIKSINGTSLLGSGNVSISNTVKFGANTSPTTSGTQVIAHGLGTTPTYMEMTAYSGGGSGVIAYSTGIYSGGIYATVSGTPSALGNGVVTSSIVNIYQGSFATQYSATVTLDATNITLTWTVGGSGTAIPFMWKVY